MICPRCNREIHPWPIRRPAKCSPKYWEYCIRNDITESEDTVSQTSFTLTSSLTKQPVTVTAEETVTPGLIVTHSIEISDMSRRRPRWHVTQIGTGLKLTGKSVSLPIARLIAGALGGLPIDWTRADKEYFYNSARDLPSEVKHWLTHSLRH